MTHVYQMKFTYYYYYYYNTCTVHVLLLYCICLYNSSLTNIKKGIHSGKGSRVNRKRGLDYGRDKAAHKSKIFKGTKRPTLYNTNNHIKILSYLYLKCQITIKISHIYSWNLFFGILMVAEENQGQINLQGHFTE